MNTENKTRIDSIDLLKGIVMVIMALDHVRDFFHADSFYFFPNDISQTHWTLFFSRFLTDFCAPAFSFLAGTSAYFIGRKMTKFELSKFLIKRGLWLIFIDTIIISFGWFFDPQFRLIELQVIWILGISMILLSFLIYLPNKILILFSCLVIFGHNLLDSIQFSNTFFWTFLHKQNYYQLSENIRIELFYPLIPWFAVMSLGYSFGGLYNSNITQEKRKKVLKWSGLIIFFLFVFLRFLNVYGDPNTWENFSQLDKSIMSFFKTSKYPPSLLFLLMTLGPALLFLAYSEKLKGNIVNFFTTFGRVPFFYYIVHIYLIHLLASLAAELSGFGGLNMIALTIWVTDTPSLKGYGFSLGSVYLIWITIILMLYPLCRKYDLYKTNNKNKWWLSYL